MFCKNKQCLLGKQERTYKLDSYIDVTIIEKQTNRKYKKMQNFHPTGICPIRDILSHLSSTMRFSDIQKSIGDISQRMLTVTLRSLETDGLISRKIYAEIPPRVEYKLTERGYSLIPHIEGLVNWAIENMPMIMKNRKTNKLTTNGQESF